MKYSILIPETEQHIATIDESDLSSGSSVEFKNGILEIRSLEKEGERRVFPAHRDAASGVVTIATALGNVRLLSVRGAMSEMSGGARSASRAMKSSMPGKVLKILCAVGDTIEPGQSLMVIEAMKMENEIRSSQAGIVEEIGVQPGQSIATGDLLVRLRND